MDVPFHSRHCCSRLLCECRIVRSLLSTAHAIFFRESIESLHGSALGIILIAHFVRCYPVSISIDMSLPSSRSDLKIKTHKSTENIGSLPHSEIDDFAPVAPREIFPTMNTWAKTFSQTTQASKFQRPLRKPRVIKEEEICVTVLTLKCHRTNTRKSLKC